MASPHDRKVVMKELSTAGSEATRTLGQAEQSEQ